MGYSDMKILKIENGTESIESEFDVLVSELPIAYIQGIRDAKGIDAVLIGNNGAEVQMKKSEAPHYTEYKTIEEALERLGYEL